MGGAGLQEVVAHGGSTVLSSSPSLLLYHYYCTWETWGPGLAAP